MLLYKHARNPNPKELPVMFVVSCVSITSLPSVSLRPWALINAVKSWDEVGHLHSRVVSEAYK